VEGKEEEEKTRGEGEGFYIPRKGGREFAMST